MIYDFFIKPILFQLDPESAHHFAASLISLSRKIPFFYQSLQTILEYRSPRLRQSIWGLEFPNPVGMAAGFDKTAELFPSLIHMGFGFVEIGTVTAKEQPGNDQPRLFRLPEHEALINRMGFNNPGAEKVKQTLQKQKKNGLRGVNAGKSKITPIEHSIDDYNFTLKNLTPYADYMVINISSPNTPGLRSLQNKNALIELIQGIQQEFGSKFPIPLFFKFAPDLNLEELRENLRVCLEYKIDGVILTNTTLDKSSLGISDPPEGGLSGNPLFERALLFVNEAYKIVGGKIPIIGVGGIDSGEKALKMFLAGASLIQLYTSYIYKGPFLPSQICSYLDRYLLSKKINHISEIVGLDHK